MGFSDFFRKVNPFLAEFKLLSSPLKENLQEDYSTYLKIKELLKTYKIRKQKITVYYPGCGSDLVNVLIMIDMLEEAKQIDIIFVDPKGAFPVMIAEMKKTTYKPKIKQSKNKATIHFKNKKINMIYYSENAFDFIPKEIENGIDLYFERAFNLFREEKEKQMNKIFPLINERGFIISDYGFELGKYKRQFVQIKNIPKNFGFYQNFHIFQKTSKHI